MTLAEKRREQRQLRYQANKEKVKDQTRKYRQANSARCNALKKKWALTPKGQAYLKTATRRNNLKRRGYTPELFDAVLAFQKGRCAICGVVLRPGRGGQQADHCHDTGEPRGILCNPCNVIEGRMRKLTGDPIMWAEALKRYLANPPAQQIKKLL